LVNLVIRQAPSVMHDPGFAAAWAAVLSCHVHIGEVDVVRRRPHLDGGAQMAQNRGGIRRLQHRAGTHPMLVLRRRMPPPRRDSFTAYAVKLSTVTGWRDRKADAASACRLVMTHM